ncbi:MAG TPA: AraC family transcriptional regulator [Chitinophaga sp.]|uniref:helix-turn-helix transcriptional regulator n=1 Tax=Chitinophaga sp. TaxID=1869181 RepID=UPI002BB92DDD|nr:AraC family transcriptional regulator [Chitinophaga sp.]HVI45364.1 AraC family transcriptional regulator [Chitinophaga sp.]
MRKDNTQNVINLLLQKVVPFEQQTLENDLAERRITLEIYRGNDFIIMDSNTVTDREVPAWQHYNQPGWVEFSFMLKGSFYQSQDGLFHDYLLPEGSHYFLFNPDADEENRLVGNGSYRIVSVYMPVERTLYLFNEYLPEFEYVSDKLQRCEPFFHEAPHKGLSLHISRMIQRLWDAPAPERLRSLYYESLVNELFCWQGVSMLEKPERTSGIKLRDTDIERLHYATQILSGSLQEQITLETLAKACQLNEYKLKAGFRQVFGTTVSDYIRDLRMKKAEELIRGTDMTMTEIAYDLGYTHSQHFQRAFKQKFGITPNSLRG